MSESSQAVADLYRTCVDEISHGPPTLRASGTGTAPGRRTARGASQNPGARQLARPHPYGPPGRRPVNRLANSSSNAIERPRTSYLEGSEGVEISGGNFVTTEGDYIGEVIYNTGVTINNYLVEGPSTAPTQVGGAQAVSGTNSTVLPVQRSCDVYNRHLACKGRGFPLWIPEPNNNLPTQYRQRGIDIGDVGIITKSGNFDFLFNICLSEDHPINGDGVPEGFSPCKPVRPSDIQRYTEFFAGAFLTSTSIDKSRYEGEYLNGTLIFESSAMEGAILTMPDGADTLELANVLHFERYMAKNVASWYKYVLVERGRQVENGEVRLVIGRDNSRTWGMATFEKASAQGDALQLKFKPMEENILGSRRYTWESSGAASARTGPSRSQIEELTTDHNRDITNQTLFVRTLNLRLRSKSWRKLTSSIAQELQQLYEDQESHDILSDSFASSPSSSGGSSAQGMDNDSRPTKEPMTHYKNLAYLGYNPPPARMAHPSDRINEMALEVLLAHSEVDVVITKDQDWMSVISEDDLVLPPAEELLARIMENNTPQVNNEDGFVFFAPIPPKVDQRSMTPPWLDVDEPATTPPLIGTASIPSAPKREQLRNLLSISNKTFDGIDPDLDADSYPTPTDENSTLNTFWDILADSDIGSSAMPMSSAPSTPHRRYHRYSPLTESNNIETDRPTEASGSARHPETEADFLLDQIYELASPVESEFLFVTPYEEQLDTLPDCAEGLANGDDFSHLPLFSLFDMHQAQSKAVSSSTTPSTSSTLSTPSTVILTPSSSSAISPSSLLSQFTGPSKSLTTKSTTFTSSSTIAEDAKESTVPTQLDTNETELVNTYGNTNWNW